LPFESSALSGVVLTSYDIPQATLNPDAPRYIDNLLAQPG